MRGHTGNHYTKLYFFYTVFIVGFNFSLDLNFTKLIVFNILPFVHITEKLLIRRRSIFNPVDKIVLLD